MPSIRNLSGSDIHTVLFGRDSRLSIVTFALAVSIAVLSAWAVGTTIGASQFATWAIETWTGQSAHLAVILSAGLLVGLGVISAYGNSGLIPTFCLVASPLFGIGLSRYGTEYAFLGTTHVVSLGEAFADGAGVAFGIGLPLAVTGFLLGLLLRRAFEDLSGGSNGPTRSKTL